MAPKVVALVLAYLATASASTCNIQQDVNYAYGDVLYTHPFSGTAGDCCEICCNMDTTKGKLKTKPDVWVVVPKSISWDECWCKTFAQTTPRAETGVQSGLCRNADNS